MNTIIKLPILDIKVEAKFHLMKNFRALEIINFHGSAKANLSGEELVRELIWDKSLSVQVQEIDEDHQKLVVLFNILNHSVEDGEAAIYINAVLEELINCTVWHFSHEERLMLKYNYKSSAEHRTEHQELIESARELQQKCLKDGRSVSSEDVQFLELWLTGHILGTDMELGSYLGEVM